MHSTRTLGFPRFSGHLPETEEVKSATDKACKADMALLGRIQG